MKIIALTKYDTLGASSRMRFDQYIKRFVKTEIDVLVEPLISNDILKFKYDNGVYSFRSIIKSYANRILVMLTINKYDLVWIEKEALPWMPLWFENIFLKNCKYVLDFDDATFHDYDQHRLKLVRFVFGKRIDGLMKQSSLVVAGNNYLAKRAKKSGANNIHVIPTVIDINRYKVKENIPDTYSESLPSIVWIGSPSTVSYLYLIKDALINLAKRHNFILKVIGANPIKIDGVNIKKIKWSEDTEISNLVTSDIGIMPLNDSSWERGKCGYKIIQYMACGLPSVASAVGANIEILNSPSVGFLASSQEDWETALDLLLSDQKLRIAIGIKARERIEARYCIQKTEADLKNLLFKVSKGVI